MAVLVGFLFVVFSRQMFRASADRDSLEAIAYTVFGLLYIPWLFNFLTKIIYLHPPDENGETTGQFYLIYLMVVTKFSDMGAYVFGSLFGRHPFCRTLAQRRPWEGLFGALVLSSLGSYWLYALIPADSRHFASRICHSWVVARHWRGGWRSGTSRSLSEALTPRFVGSCRNRRYARLIDSLLFTRRSCTSISAWSSASHENAPRRYSWSHGLDWLERTEGCPRHPGDA